MLRDCSTTSHLVRPSLTNSGEQRGRGGLTNMTISSQFACDYGWAVLIKIVPRYFFEKILRYYYIPTIGVADLQAPLNNMLRSS